MKIINRKESSVVQYVCVQGYLKRVTEEKIINELKKFETWSERLGPHKSLNIIINILQAVI